MVRDAPSKSKAISADCHGQEPLDLWQARIDAKYRDRLPRIEVINDKEYSMAEGQRPIRGREPKLEGEDLERSRAGQPDSDKRLADLHGDGVDAEVLYPNRALAMLSPPDPEFQLAQGRVHNDWLLEVFGSRPDIFASAAIVPALDVCLAGGEVEWATAKAGVPAAAGAQSAAPSLDALGTWAYTVVAHARRVCIAPSDLVAERERRNLATRAKSRFGSWRRAGE